MWRVSVHKHIALHDASVLLENDDKKLVTIACTCTSSAT